MIRGKVGWPSTFEIGSLATVFKRLCRVREDLPFPCLRVLGSGNRPHGLRVNCLSLHNPSLSHEAALNIIRPVLYSAGCWGWGAKTDAKC